MKCGQPMFRPGETYSSRDCQLQLGHPGAHEYFGDKMPRPEPSSGLDPEVTAMLDRIAREKNIWHIDERTYQVVFEVTTVYAVNVSAESEDAALHMYEDLADLPDFDEKGQAIDGSVEVRRIDPFERADFLTPGSPDGPLIACPDCGELAERREWFHKPLRRCHGPIVWRETAAPSLRRRYRREFAATPVHAPTTTTTTTGGPR